MGDTKPSNTLVVLSSAWDVLSDEKRRKAIALDHPPNRWCSGERRPKQPYLKIADDWVCPLCVEVEFRKEYKRQKGEPIPDILFRWEPDFASVNPAILALIDELITRMPGLDMKTVKKQFETNPKTKLDQADLIGKILTKVLPKRAPSSTMHLWRQLGHRLVQLRQVLF